MDGYETLSASLVLLRCTVRTKAMRELNSKVEREHQRERRDVYRPLSNYCR